MTRSMLGPSDSDVGGEMLLGQPLAVHPSLDGRGEFPQTGERA